MLFYEYLGRKSDYENLNDENCRRQYSWKHSFDFFYDCLCSDNGK